MPPPPHRPNALAWQVFRGSAAIRSGLLTEHQLRGKAWLRLCYDVYADARLERDHWLACQAAALRLPPEATIAGPSAAFLHGVEHAARFVDHVHVLVPRGIQLRSQQGLRVHSMDLESIPVQAACTPPRTAGAPCAWETAVWLDPVRAVGIVDALLARGLVTRRALTDIATQRACRPGGQRARKVFDLADPGAQSPPESHLRVRLVLGGLPPPVTQHPVAVPSGLILHPDLAWPEFMVAVEYDGHWHGDPDRLHHDRQRLNQLVGAGWLVLHVTSRRLRTDFPGILREVRSALHSRGWRP